MLRPSNPALSHMYIAMHLPYLKSPGFWDHFLVVLLDNLVDHYKSRQGKPQL